MDQERIDGVEDPSIDEVAAAWNRIADAYDHAITAGSAEDYYRQQVFGPAQLEACGSVAGLDVIDLGCGQGYFCRLLAQEGAVVAGVDIASNLLAHARRHEASDPLGITYVEIDAALVGDRWPVSSFDIATACMSLHDMPKPKAVLEGVARLLRPDGRFVFSVPHPLTDTPYREWVRLDDGRNGPLRLDRYFETGPCIMSWSMPSMNDPWDLPSHRRTLEEWSDLIGRAGFMIQRLREPRPTAAQVASDPRLDDCYRVPYFLIVEAKPTGD